MRLQDNTYSKEGSHWTVHCWDGNGLPQGKFLISEEDLHLVKKHHWNISPRKAVSTQIGQRVLLGAFLTQRTVIHLDHNPLNFQRHNLKMSSKMEQGHLGPCSISLKTTTELNIVPNSRLPFRPSITIQTMRIELGRYDQIEDAVKVKRMSKEHVEGIGSLEQQALHKAQDDLEIEKWKHLNSNIRKVPGISRRKDQNTWRVDLSIQGRVQYVGQSKDLRQARRIRRRWEWEHKIKPLLQKALM